MVVFAIKESSKALKYSHSLDKLSWDYFLIIDNDVNTNIYLMLFTSFIVSY
jgi:hypothetical protein